MVTLVQLTLSGEVWNVRVELSVLVLVNVMRQATQGCDVGRLSMVNVLLAVQVVEAEHDGSAWA